MIIDLDLPESIKATLEKDEQVLWSGKPKVYWFFSGRNLAAFIVMTMCSFFVWIGVITIGELIGIDWSDYEIIPGELESAILSIAIVWFLFVVYIISSYINQHRKRYFISLKRIGTKWGIISDDLVTTEYNKISDISVSVSFRQKLWGVGSVWYQVTGSNTMYVFEDIKKPYEVYKLIKENMEKHKV